MDVGASQSTRRHRAPHRRPRRLPVRRRRLQRLVAAPRPRPVVEFHDPIADPDALVARLDPSTSSSRCGSAPIPRECSSDCRPAAARHHRHAQPLHRPRRRHRAGDHRLRHRTRRTPPSSSPGADPRHPPQHPAGGLLHPRRRMAADLGGDLAGARLGVVGLGGMAAGWRGRHAFGMDVVAWSQNLTDERAAEVGVRRVEHDEFFATSDVVTVHLLCPATRGLIGAEDLGRMKPTAILVNTSRGPIVDQRRWSTRCAGPHRRRRPRRLRPGAAAAPTIRCARAAHRADPAPGLRHPGHLRGLLRRGRGGRRRLDRRQPRSAFPLF